MQEVDILKGEVAAVVVVAASTRGVAMALNPRKKECFSTAVQNRSRAAWLESDSECALLGAMPMIRLYEGAVGARHPKVSDVLLGPRDLEADQIRLIERVGGILEPSYVGRYHVAAGIELTDIAGNPLDQFLVLLHLTLPNGRVSNRGHGR